MWVLWVYLTGMVIAWGVGIWMLATGDKPRDREDEALNVVAVLAMGIIWPLTALVLLVWTATDRLRERLKDAKENRG